MHTQLTLKLIDNILQLRYLLAFYLIHSLTFGIGQTTINAYLDMSCDSLITTLKAESNLNDSIHKELQLSLKSNDKWECLYRLNYATLESMPVGLSYETEIEFIHSKLDPIYEKAYKQVKSSDQFIFEIEHLLMHADALSKSDDQLINMETGLLHIINKLDNENNNSDYAMLLYAITYNSLCFLYEKQGRYHEGLGAAQYIIHILSQQYGVDGQVNKYGNMNTHAGTFAMHVNEFTIAEENILKALRFFMKLNRKAEKEGNKNKHSNSLRNLYIKLAQLKMKQQDSNGFFTNLKEAEKYPVDFSLALAEPSLLRGKYYQDKEEYTSAITHYQKIFDNISTTDTSHYLTIAHVYNSLGECELELRDTSASINLFTKSFSFATRNQNKNIFASDTNMESIRSYRNLAKLYTSKGDLENAGINGQKLIQELQYIRSDHYFLLDKIRLLENTYDDYGILLQIIFEQGHVEQAYTVMQLGKAQLMKEAKIKSLYQDQLELQEDKYINDIKSQLLADHLSEQHIDSLQNELYKRKEKYKSRQSKHIKESVLTAIQMDLRPLADFQNLLNDKEVILEYYLGNEHAFCLELSNTSIQLHKLIHPDSINHNAREFSHQLIHKHNLDSKIKRLSKLLLPSTLDSSYNRFVIIPDGILHYIPFEVLAFNKTTLLDHAAVSYLLYNDMLQARAPKTIRDQDILLVAPSFTKAAFKNLKFSATEVQNIQHLINGKISSGEQASKTYFVNESPMYKILHLSTHAQIDNSDSEQSFIAFHDAENNYKLFLHQIEQLALQSEMVVLSACETGIGKLLSGEGMFSMKKAFFMAGSKSVVSSLWPSNDQTTAEIMSYFYKNLKEGKTKDEALRQAKLTYISLADPGYDHPYYWAGFIAVGDMSTLTFNDLGHLKYILCSGFLVLLLALFFSYKKRKHKVLF